MVLQVCCQVFCELVLARKCKICLYDHFALEAAQFSNFGFRKRPQQTTESQISRAGHLQCFFIFSIIKSDTICTFYQVNLTVGGLFI